MTRDDKIKKALAKQAKDGSPYANDRNMSMTYVPGHYHNHMSQQDDGVGKMLNALRSLRQTRDEKDYFVVDGNLIYPDFKNKSRKKEGKLTVNHATGKITVE